MKRTLEDTPHLTTEQKRVLVERLLREKAGGMRLNAEPLPGLFEAQVDRSPDSVALAFGDRRLSYRELNARANRLAHRLRALGVGPDILVGLCIDRSPEMVVGLLGIVKAGGAYVPLDPEYPPARLAFMLEDARVSVL